MTTFSCVILRHCYQSYCKKKNNFTHHNDGNRRICNTERQPFESRRSYSYLSSYLTVSNIIFAFRSTLQNIQGERETLNNDIILHKCIDIFVSSLTEINQIKALFIQTVILPAVAQRAITHTTTETEELISMQF